MINIKPIIYKELSKIAENVTDTYPDNWEHFPVVIFLENKTSRMNDTATKNRRPVLDTKLIFLITTQQVV